MLKNYIVIFVLSTAVLSACGQKTSTTPTPIYTDEAESSEGNVGIVRNDSASGIYTRTTARSFSNDLVSDEQTESLIRAAFTSPTGGNQRAWEFIVVTDREIMKEIQTGHPYSEALDTAPLVIIVAANESGAGYQDLLEFDSGIATQSILIQASELGLSSVAMSIAPQEERIQAVVSAVNLPDHIVPHMMVAIGYPETDGVSSASVDYFDEGKVHYNQYP